MNADDSRRRTWPNWPGASAPPERDLPAGRQQALKEHLISELRLADTPPAGPEASLRRRKAMTLIAAAGVAALAAVAIMLSLLPGNTSGASPAAARLLAKIASTAARQPGPQVRDSQFWYVESRCSCPYPATAGPSTTASWRSRTNGRSGSRCPTSASPACCARVRAEHPSDLFHQFPALPVPGRRARPHLPVPAVAAHRPACPAQSHRAGDARTATAARRKHSPPSATCSARRSRRRGSALRSTGLPP